MVDQRRIDDQRWVDSRTAAKHLGIQQRTLYAYVSRGQVRSVAGEHGRPRLYSLADLERLRVRRDARAGHGAVAAGALRWGEPVLDSALYPAGDPRTAPVLDLTRQLLASARPHVGPRARTLLAVIDAVSDAAKRDRSKASAEPSVDVGLAALVDVLGALPAAGPGLFAVARSAGWLAHALEQRAAGFLLRPSRALHRCSRRLAGDAVGLGRVELGLRDGKPAENERQHRAGAAHVGFR